MSLNISLSVIGRVEIFETNITHNLGKMAEAAGVYVACWHPERINAKRAKDIIPWLEDGVKSLKQRPEYFKQYDAKNGWGTYEQFLPWLEEYLEACYQNPDAEIEASV